MFYAITLGGAWTFLSEREARNMIVRAANHHVAERKGITCTLVLVGAEYEPGLVFDGLTVIVPDHYLDRFVTEAWWKYVVA